VIHLNPIAAVPVNARVTYWLDLWDEQLRLYLRHPDGFVFTTATVLLDILIEDTARRHPRSGPIRGTLLTSLSGVRNSHPLFRQSQLGIDLSLILEEYGRSDLALVNLRARELRNILDSRTYSKAVATKIADLVDDDRQQVSNQARKDLIELTRDAIGRLLRHGFSVDSAIGIPARIFSSAVGDDKHKTTRVPKHFIKLDADGRTGSRHPLTPLSPEEEAAIAALTARDRILLLAEYMHAEPIPFRCYFAVDGLSGRTRCTIGGVTFYPPATESCLPTEARVPSGVNHAELFGRDPALNPITAYLEVTALDRQQADVKSRAILDDVINVVNLASPPPPNVEVRRWPWLYIDPYGLGLYGTIGRLEPQPDNLHFTTKQVEAIPDEIKNLRTSPEISEGRIPEAGLEHEIGTALHWLRRAEQSSRLEDQLLFNWLAFEKLFSDPNKGADSLKTIGAIDGIISVLYPTIDMYTYALQLTELPVVYIDRYWAGAHYSDHGLRLSREQLLELLQQDGPMSSKSINETLRRNLDKIRDGRLKERITEYLHQIDDATSTHALLMGSIKRSATDMTIIYWLRNRLVHGGEFAFPALAYFLEILRDATRTMLKLVADKRNWPPEATHPLDILIPIYIDATRLLNGLRDGKRQLATLLSELGPIYPETSFDLHQYQFLNE
jgi:hypothetical protein